MNEILAMRQVKRIMRYGIPKVEAKSIVSECMEVVGTDNEAQLENAINYAISLTYRIAYSKIN